MLQNDQTDDQTRSRLPSRSNANVTNVGADGERPVTRATLSLPRDRDRNHPAQLQTSHPQHHHADRKMAFGQLRQAVSTQLCDLLDDAGINATRVVSGRRFVRWDTVPKLLSQQNRYISGLPYDFFFSKAISPISTTSNNASAPTPTAIAASTSIPTPSRKRHSYHNSDSDTYSNEMAPPLVPSSSETDASYGINPDTDVDTEMELSVDVLNQADKGSPEVIQESMTVPPPTDENGNSKQGLSVDVETPTSTTQTIITQLHAQPLNINILSWKKSTIEDILAGLRSGRIHVASRPQGRDVVFELITPDNESIDIPKWPEVHIPNVMNSSNGDVSHVLSPAGPSASQGAPFSTPPSTSTPWNTPSQYQAEVGAIRNTRSDRERRRRLSIGGASPGAGGSNANPPSRGLRIRGIPGGGRLTAGGVPVTAPVTPTRSPPISEDVKPPNNPGESIQAETENVAHARGSGRLSNSPEDRDDDNSPSMTANHGDLWAMEEQDEGDDEQARGRQISTDSPLVANSSGQRLAPASSSATAVAPPRTTFLTTPTPTKKWTRRSSPDRIFMNVTLNGLLRSAGMPIPRQKDDASRLPWSSIPQFLAERGLYVTGWPEANLPWLYAGDDGAATGNGSGTGAKGASGGEWKDRIDWKSSPSQRSYKPLAQALRNGDIKILKRPSGREVLFEVRDAQGRCYDSTLGLSDEWKRRWMYGGGTPGNLTPTHNGIGNAGTNGGSPLSRKTPAGTLRPGERHTSDMDVDIEEHKSRRGHHSRSFSNPVVFNEHEREYFPSSENTSASTHQDRRTQYDGRSSGYVTTGSSTPLAHSTTYPPYQDYPQTHHRSIAPPPATYDMRTYPHRHDSRQYMDDARFQRVPPPSNSTAYQSQSSNSASYHPHSATSALYHPQSSSSTAYHHQGHTHPPHGHHIPGPSSSSGPVPIPGSGSGLKREKDTPSPDSPTQRQRTLSLGTSSASTGTMLSALSSSSASISNRRGYNLPPIRDPTSGASAEGSRRNVFKDERDESGGEDMRRNRLPPIQLPFEDTDEEKKAHHVLLPPVKSLSPMSAPLTGSATPATRSPMDSRRWYPIPSRSSNSQNLSPTIITKSSPPDIRPKSLLHPSHRTSSPTSNALPSIPKHFPMPREAFSAPFWDAVQRVWRLHIMDGPKACLPPVGDRIEWDGRWVLNSGAGEGAPFAFWSVEQEAWVLVS